MPRRYAILFALLVISIPFSPALSQETQGQAAPQDAVTEPATGVAASAAAADYDRLFTEWKANLAQLRDIYQAYQTAEESELADLERQWQEQIDRGRQLVGPLTDAAVAKYASEPNQDRQLAQFLVKLAADKIRSDDYPGALKIMKVLVEHQCDEREVDNLAGIAAYGSNEFEFAETHLQEADRSGTLSEQGQNFLAGLADTQSAWVREEQLRQAEAEADDLPRVKFITDQGEIVLELFENEAPETVGNFISLAEKGFYDGLTFHRVIQGFMAQGGCPKGDGTGGPGYKIYCECLNEDHRNHFAGSLSMAKESANHTGGSQFFITFVPTPHLNGRHTVFGRVIEGMDVLPKIVKRDPSQPQALEEPTRIERVEIIRKRDHEYLPNKVK